MLHFLAADPGPALQADWLNLTDATNLVRVVGFLIPVLTALVAKKVASSGLKSVVTLVLSALTATIATIVAADGHGFAWQAFVNAFLNTFGPAIVTYYGLWKPTGLAGTVAQATQGFGVGPRPVLETEDKGAEAPSSAAGRGRHEAGSASLGFVLVVAGLVLLLFALVVAGLHYLFWFGVILLVIGAVLAYTGRSRTL